MVDGGSFDRWCSLRDQVSEAARLDYKSVQTAVDGLRCTVTIELQTRRESSTTAYDVLTYVLGDIDGWPIGLAAPASPLKLHRQTADLGKREAYLDVIAVSRNGAASNIDEELAEDDISIGGHEHYVYEVAIRPRPSRVPGSADGGDRTRSIRGAVPAAAAYGVAQVEQRHRADARRDDRVDVKGFQSNRETAAIVQRTGRDFSTSGSDASPRRGLPAWCRAGATAGPSPRRCADPVQGRPCRC